MTIDIRNAVRKWRHAPLLLALAGASSAWAAPKAADAPPAPKANAPLAIVNGMPLPVDYAGLMLRDRGVAATQVSDDLKKEIAQRLVTNELLVQEAAKIGLDKDPEVVLRTEMLRRDAIANAYVAWFLRNNPVDEAQVRQDYESRKAKLGGEKEYSLRHILVGSKEQADAILQQLKGNVDFGQLVEKYSLDQGGSRNYGGSLGWISVETADPVLLAEVAKLKAGQTAPAPVQTRFGWHVIRLEGVRDIQILPYESVKDRLMQQAQIQKVMEMEGKLVQKSSISFSMK